MKVIVISDTHTQHRKLGRLKGDVLVHCGDIEMGMGKDVDVIADLDEWFGTLDFNLILVTGGNHDFGLRQLLRKPTPPFKNAVFLCDQTVKSKRVIFHGSPWVPALSSWEFHADREDRQKAWAKIPMDCDVLITHTPPHGMLDTSRSRKGLGCPFLLDRVSKVSPKYHLFGHIHNSRGKTEFNGTTFVNATSVNSQYELVHMPFEVKL